MKSQDYDENEKNNNDKDDENGASDTDESLDRAELIEKTGEVVSHNAKHLIHCLTVIGQVEGHYVLPSQNKTTKYEHIMPALVAIEQDRTIEGLVIILNTVGGDVEAGLAIAELIAGMKTPTVSLVVGVRLGLVSVCWPVTFTATTPPGVTAWVFSRTVALIVTSNVNS